jgi:DNA-binding CsgD family transcriptional regulator
MEKSGEGFTDIACACCVVVRVDAQLHVHARNAGADRLRERDSLLRLGPGDTLVATADLRRQLRLAVGGALARPGEVRASAVPRPGRLPATLSVAADGPGRARIEWRDPEWTVLDEALARELFGLTRTEAVVAARLCHGAAPADIADGLGVQRNTVSAHTKKLLAKCGVRRQPELVALLLRSVASRCCPNR